MISNMYETKLKQDGFDVIIASDGSLGLEMGLSERPDIVLLDVILPQIDGFSILEELRANSSTKNIPIIMLTNLGTEEDQKKGEALGATDYWVKANLTPSQVSEKINEYLNK